MYRKIDALTQQLEKKGYELQREREATEALTKKVQDLQATSAGFEALAAQSNEILHMLKQRDVQADGQHRYSAEEIRDK